MNKYTLGFLRKVQESDQNRPGVALALEFIEYGVPVTEVAEKAGVSRMTVYNWFTGVTNPSEDKIEIMEKILDEAFEALEKD